VGLRDSELAPLRGDLMSMVFQEPMTALDPTMPVGRQVAEVLLLHQHLGHGVARGRVIERIGDNVTIVTLLLGQRPLLLTVAAAVCTPVDEPPERW